MAAYARIARSRGSNLRFTRLVLAVAALVLVCAVARPADAQSFEVLIGAGLQPSSLIVPVGASVTWRNQDGERHRMHSQSGPEEFDSGNLDPGGTFTHVFSAEGTYDYSDERNAGASQYFGRIVVSAGATGAAAPGAGGASTPAPATATVRMAGRRFSPSTVTIAVGGTVTFNNDDGDEHTATARDRSFDSGTLAGGAQFQHTFDAVGRFAFICAFHSDMSGEIVVTDATGATPPAAPSPPPSTPTTAPGSGGTGATGGPAAASIVDFDFAPSTVSVQAGQSVTWTNDGIAPHTVTASDGSFDSGMMSGGQAYTRTFPTVGRFPFLCAVHPSMVGEVVVTGQGGTAPPAAAAVPRSSAPPASVGLAASGGSTGAAAGSFVATMLDFEFGPSVITIERGTTVTWTNAGAAPHTATAEDGSFDSGWVNGGEAATLTFTKTGDFAFYCALHPNMTGRISVLEPDDFAIAAGVTEGGPTTQPAGAPGAEETGVAEPAPGGDAVGGSTDGLSIALLTVILLVVAAIGVVVGYIARRLETETGGPTDNAR